MINEEALTVTLYVYAAPANCYPPNATADSGRSIYD